MIARSLISKNHLPLQATMTVSEGLAIMNSYQIKALPVVSVSNMFLGCIELEDLQSESPQEKIENLSDYFTQNKAFDYQHIYEIIEKSFSEEIACIPIVEESNTYVGLITCNQILQYFANISSLHNSGAIIVIELPIKDYSLSRISQIIEENNAKIMSLHTNISSETALIEVTLKLNTHDISEIIENFNRFDYSIKTYYEGFHRLHELYKDRIDSLQNYLNI